MFSCQACTSADEGTRQNLGDALQATDEALDQIVNFGRVPFYLSQTQRLISDIRVEQITLGTVIEGEANITSLIDTGQEVKRDEYVDPFTRVTCTLIEIITWRLFSQAKKQSGRTS